jgi:hypothetical protein
MEEGFKPCPHCAEPIREAAIVCRYCHQPSGISLERIVKGVVIGLAILLIIWIYVTVNRHPAVTSSASLPTNVPLRVQTSETERAAAGTFNDSDVLHGCQALAQRAVDLQLQLNRAPVAAGNEAQLRSQLDQMTQNYQAAVAASERYQQAFAQAEAQLQAAQTREQIRQVIKTLHDILH